MPVIEPDTLDEELDGQAGEMEQPAADEETLLSVPGCPTLISC
ncbi:hypothetical protein [Streptomyces nogalater]|uniref:Uncharacterized protein n=1 Tax=Streptomyces nogalater TaxID=38314 RepID=A0ABW0WSR7_STRNO